MKLKIYIFSIIIFSNSISFAQTPNWLWAKKAGGVNGDRPQTIAVDVSGNIYMAGYFNSPTITFGATILTNMGVTNIFLVKYDASGNVIWAQSAGGTSNDIANSIAIDMAGNVYLSGNFISTSITFGSTIIYNNGGAADIFLVKFDANGNVIWAKTAGGVGYDVPYSIEVDLSDNIYMAGTYDATFTFGSTVLTWVGVNDLFILKYDANGNPLWAKSAGGVSDDDAMSVALDGSGNIFMTGYFKSNTITIGSHVLTNSNSNNTSDIFLVKYDPNGNVLFAKSAGGTLPDEALSVGVDSSGNSYITGWFESSTMSFGSTFVTNSNSVGSFDSFLTKYDTNGNVQWAKSTGGLCMDEAYSVSVDATGNTFMAGWFMGNGIINFGSSVYLTNTVGNNMFIAKYNTNGNALWAKDVGGGNNNIATNIAVDASDNAYVAGWYENSTIVFDTTVLTNAGNDDVFLAKIGLCTINTLISHTESCYGSNNGTATATVSGVDGPYTYLWNTIPIQTTATVYSLTPGIYSVTVTDANSCSAKYSVIINENPLPSVNESDDTTVCDSINNAVLTASGGSSYLWSYNNLTTPTISISTDTTTTYFVTVTDNNGCFASDSIVITINPSPHAEAFNDTIVCGSIYNDVLTANGGNSYLWSYNNLNTQSITVTTDTTSIYTVTVTNAEGCTAFDSVIITVNPLPIANVIKDTTVCNGTKDTLFASGGVSYLWNYNNLTTQNIVVSPSATATYTVTITDINGCTASDNATITVDTLNFISISLISGGTVLSCNQLLPHYQWYFNGNLIAGAISQVYMPFVNGNYIVVGTDSFGCSVTSSQFNFVYVDINESINNNSFDIFPNPSNDNITVVTSISPSIEFLNMQGQIIKRLKIKDNQTNIDISAFPAGVYIVEMTTGNGVVVKKFVKE